VICPRARAASSSRDCPEQAKSVEEVLSDLARAYPEP
jgi:hypothetical protein